MENLTNCGARPLQVPLQTRRLFNYPSIFGSGIKRNFWGVQGPNSMLVNQRNRGPDRHHRIHQLRSLRQQLEVSVDWLVYQTPVQ